jgi:phospholipid/cholesterol/gamma-HCH transport system substrate-binding protein
MRSRVVREGSVGLLILLGLGCTVGISAWLRGASLGGRYSLAVELTDAVGLNIGSPVKYRGVKVGRVNSLTPSIDGVVAQVDISPPSLVIPRDSSVSVTQSGFIGQVELSIQPKKAASSQPIASNLSPYRPKCDESVILCDGDRLKGGIGANFDELIQSTTKLANLLSENELIDNANTTLKAFTATSKNISVLSRNTSRTLKDVSVAANGFTGLSQETRQQLRQVGPVSTSVTRAANQVSVLGNRLDTTATQVNSLIQVNRGSLTSTLGNLQEASQDLKVTVKDLSPILGRIEKGKLLDNLETLAENGAKASTNLKNLTATINNPATVLGLAQTLDSARVTFQNTQKITTDLEQVTGNPKFRQNLIKLINGLSKLVSSSQTLDQQLSAIQSAPSDSTNLTRSDRLTRSDTLTNRTELLHSDKISSELPSPLVFSDTGFPLFSKDRFETLWPVLTDRQASFSDPFLTQSLRPSSP